MTAPATIAPVIVRWTQEARDFLVTTLALVAGGAAVGLVWAAVAPQLAIVSALRGSEAAFKAEIGADFWFLVVGTAAGVVSAAVVLAMHRDGPGTSLGLAAGGITGGFVADRVGYLAHHAATLDALHSVGVSLRALQDFGLDPFFELRALGVIVAWPLAAVLVHAVVVAARTQRG